MTRMLKLASAGVGVAALLGLMGASSFANFTGSAARNGSNQPPGFQAGRVQIGLTPSSNMHAIAGSNVGGTWHEYTETSNGMVTSLDAITNMAPGDTWQRVFTITNNGTLPELYQVNISTSGNLFSPGWVGSMPSPNNPSAAGAAKVSVTGQGTDGTIYHIVSGAFDGVSGVTNPKQWFEIEPGKTEHILVNVSLPYVATNAYQGQSGNFTINLSSQQADNYAQNPANAGIGINYLT